MGRVQDKVALVTGGSMGLGAATAMLLAREGASIVVTDINDAEGEKVVETIVSRGDKAIYLTHDVASETDWQSTIQKTIERFGRLDILVNNAGVGFGCPPEEQTLDDWRRLMSVNLDGVFLGTKHAIRAMKERKPLTTGSIINLSSIEGLVGDPNLGAYNASKGGVRLYTKSVALYCATARSSIADESRAMRFGRSAAGTGIE